MFVHIERQFINMHAVVSIDEGINGQLRLNLANGKTVYAKTAEEIELVKGALDQLAYKPVQISAAVNEPAPVEQKTARKKAG